MFAYCLNNPVRYCDAEGKLVAEAVLSTFALCAVIVIGSDIAMRFFTKAASELLTYVSSLTYRPFSTESIEGNVVQAEVDKAEHTKNKSERTRNKHEEGNARRQRDQGGEKKKQRKGWQSNPNKNRARCNIDEECLLSH